MRENNVNSGMVNDSGDLFQILGRQCQLITSNFMLLDHPGKLLCLLSNLVNVWYYHDLNFCTTFDRAFGVGNGHLVLTNMMI